MRPEGERIGDLLLDRLAPRGPARPRPLLLVHGMWGGSGYFANPLSPAAARGWAFSGALQRLERLAGGPRERAAAGPAGREP